MKQYKQLVARFPFDNRGLLKIKAAEIASVNQQYLLLYRQTKPEALLLMFYLFPTVAI